MLIDDDSLYLYNLTLQAPSYYLKSIVGCFIQDKNEILSQQQIILVSSNHLKLILPNSETGKLEIKSSQNLIGVINQVEKITINKLDYLVIASDSGNLSILKFNPAQNKFVAISQIGYTKSGWNKTYPGEYLSIDPQNRCVLIGAIEKNKLMYRLDNIDEDGSINLSDPLEANTKNLYTLKLVSLDTDYGNPLFIALEINEFDDLLLNYYELDMGLNHIVRKKSTKVEEPYKDLNYIIPLPSYIEGIFTFGKNWCCFQKFNNGENIYLPLPKRSKSQDSIIISHVSHIMKRKTKEDFFILVQNTFGDLFKIMIDYDFDREIIKNIKLTYFDTIQPCINLNILKSGFLFANVLNNDKLFYQFEKLGDEENENDLIINSIDYSEEKIRDCNLIFQLKGLDNLALIDIFESLNPIIDIKLIDNNLTTICSHSYLKKLLHGQPTTILVESPLPITPTDIFTTKLTKDSANDEWLIISSVLSNQTLILSIGEVVQDVEDSNFILDQPTIQVQQVGESSLIQIYSNGIRHINKNKKITNWYPPAGIAITKATTNNQQVLIALSNLELVYFETDIDDQLIEYQDKLEIQSSIISIAIKSDTKSDYAIIGCSDETIQVVSLKPSNCLSIQSLQALSSNASSIIITSNGFKNYVHIGMENGVYVRTEIDLSGKLLDSRIKYLGSKPIKLSKIQLNEEIKQGVLAISSKPWIVYNYQNNFKIIPLLNISNITQGLSFISEDIGGEGIVGFYGNNLTIFSIGKEDSEFDPNQEFLIEKLKLRYQPKKLLTHGKKLIIAESEYNVKPIHEPNLTNKKEPTIDQDYYDAFGYEEVLNSWSSCLQIIESDNIVQNIQFQSNEYITNVAKALFGNKNYLIVGITTDQTFLPNSHKSSYLLTFRFDKKKNNLQYLHKTDLDIYPHVIESFNNKLLIGDKNIINLYELGTKQFLRKSQTNFNFINNINKVLVHDSRVWICDSNLFITLCKFDEVENKFIAFAKDLVKRQVTTIINLDFDTILIGDKFGSISIIRIDKNISNQSINDWTILKQQSKNNIFPIYKLSNFGEFYIPDIITCFNKGSLINSNQECIIYSGVQGTIGFLLPLLTKSEIELLSNLQIELGSYVSNELGKDFFKYRSYYNPIKNIIDGDYIEKFLSLKNDEKVKIGKKLKKSSNEIEKKLIDLRNRCI
ncbi:unnamed protein product [Candida verbasci]|uniref:Pre-mRNA-splicing factor RSE1 n=1 Tax=Candida verbasci TaxID=1227364 RepID=A0A9W4TWC0_9ASCO|nr:unnamed protein product [Candida verbasci]